MWCDVIENAERDKKNNEWKMRYKRNWGVSIPLFFYSSGLYRFERHERDLDLELGYYSAI